MAAAEGALVARTNRGCRATAVPGGATNDHLQRQHGTRPVYPHAERSGRRRPQALRSLPRLRLDSRPNQHGWELAGRRVHCNREWMNNGATWNPAKD